MGLRSGLPSHSPRGGNPVGSRLTGSTAWLGAGAMAGLGAVEPLMRRWASRAGQPRPRGGDVSPGADGAQQRLGPSPRSFCSPDTWRVPLQGRGPKGLAGSWLGLLCGAVTEATWPDQGTGEQVSAGRLAARGSPAAQPDCHTIGLHLPELEGLPCGTAGWGCSEHAIL